MTRDELSKLICERLKNDSVKIRQHWDNSTSKTPTHHVSIDNLLPEEVAMEIYNSFPHNSDKWKRFDTFRERKFTMANISQANQLISEITFALQSPDVIKAVEELTGIRGVQPDPGLYAGGISMMKKDDFLNPHIDNSHDAKRNRYRKLNLLYYITPDWALEDGGNLELWDQRVTRPVEIFSKFNRLVLMETNKTSWHSVNKVKKPSANRCCVSNYYFAPNPAPYEKDYFHVTSFMARPGQKFKRAYSNFDNFLRQAVAQNLRISRGTNNLNTQR